MTTLTHDVLCALERLTGPTDDSPHGALPGGATAPEVRGAAGRRYSARGVAGALEWLHRAGFAERPEEIEPRYWATAKGARAASGAA